MFRMTVAAAALALLPLAAFAEDKELVKDVTVEADFSAIRNAEAAQYWANVPADLENAIVSRLANRLDEEKGSVDIRVSLDVVKLADGFRNPAADSRMSGRVVMRNNDDASEQSVYDLTVTMDQAKVYLPETMTVATVLTDSREYYDAMVQSFADVVVEDMKKQVD